MSAAPGLVDLQETLYRSKNPTRRWLHCSRRDWLLAALQRLRPNNKNATCALEVGPGSGLYLPVLAEAYAEAVAVDIESAYLQHARRYQTDYPNLRLQIDDMARSQLAEAQFDLVLCTEVVEHTLESAAMLQQIGRVLKPGGHLLLSTPQPYSPLELAAKIAFLPGIIQMVRWIYREPILETGHINLMSAAALQTQIRAAGLEVLETHKSGLYLPLIAEFLGHFGLRLEQWLENKLRGTRWDGLLWTQYYVVRKPLASA